MKTKGMNRRCQVSGVRYQLSGLGFRLHVSGLGDESRAGGTAKATGGAECCVWILKVGLVVRMSQIYRVLALTSYSRFGYRNSPEKKMLKRGVRSRNVYENKGNKDKAP